MRVNRSSSGWSLAAWLLPPLLLVLTALFLVVRGVMLAGPQPPPAQVQEQPAATASEDTTPWPVLDDGRVVFTVYGTKLAMPACPRCLDYEFHSDGMDYRLRDQSWLKVRDAIAHPERLRFIEANSRKVRLRMWNDWRPEVNQGPFLGRFDPRSLPQTSELDLILYRPGRTDPCWLGPPNVSCLGTHELDVAGRRAGQVVAGMSVTRGPYVRSYSELGAAGIFGFSKGEDFYLAPVDHPRDAVGLPVRLLCVPLGRCYSSDSGSEGGYALLRDANVLFSFQAKKYALDEWVELHDRLIQAVRTLLVE